MDEIYVIINYLVFAIVCIIGLVYVVTPTKSFKDPFNSTRLVLLSGEQSFFLFTLMTGIVMSGNVSALRLLVWIVYVLVCILKSHNKILFTPTVFFYIIFLLWIGISIMYSPVKTYGIRVFLKYLYPFLILCIATQLTNSYVFYTKSLKTILAMAIGGIIVYFVLFRVPFLSSLSSHLFWNYPAYLDFLPVAIAISLAVFSYSNQKKYLLLAIVFLTLSIIAVNRTGLVSAVISFLAFFLIKNKIKAVPYIILFVILFVSVVLYVPKFRSKMFKEQLTADQIIQESDNLTSEDIDSSGRFAMWRWSLDNFYDGKELIGSGLGVLQETFYSFRHPFGKIRIVHNDYVQLLCDTGLIGLTFYGLVFLSLVIHSASIYLSKKNTPNIRFAALISFVAMTGMISALYTDNVVNYSLFTLSYPFGLYGMMLGLKKYTQPNHS